MKYDLFDFKDHFVKIGTKVDAKNFGFFTRSVHILLFNSEGEVMICKRSPDKKNYPNMLTSSAGGHVEQGESYKVAAVRELKEELGVTTSLKDYGRFDVITSRERAIHHLFIGKTYKKIHADPREISSYSFLSIKALTHDINFHPHKYCKPFHEAFKCLLNNSKHFKKLR